MIKLKTLLTYLILAVIVLIVPTFLVALGTIIYIVKFGHLYHDSKRLFTIILWFHIFIIMFEAFKFFKS